MKWEKIIYHDQTLQIFVHFFPLKVIQPQPIQAETILLDSESTEEATCCLSQNKVSPK